MKEKKYAFTFILFNAAFSFFIIFFIVNAIRFAGCFSAAENVLQTDSQIMRIKLYNSGDESVSAVVSILDTDGSDCAVIERSWHGTFLAADFMCASFSGKNFYFPKQIYGLSNISAANSTRLTGGSRGTYLFPYYNENSLCLLAGKSRPASEKALYKISSFAFNPAAAVAAGFVSKISVNLAGLENGKYYGIFTENGNLVLREE